ncbi:hypothetical protein LGN12_25105 [Burkholderia multivorans]|nr:hypothetical protein [Burkholderia multivorans]
MGIFDSWSRSLVGKPWIRLDDAGIILAGGSPRSGAPRNNHFQADRDHWLSLVTDAIARGVIATTERDGVRYVRQADLRRWCDAGGMPWKIPRHPDEDDIPAAGHPEPASSDRRSNDETNALDPREHITLLVLIAAAARAGTLDAAAIERATDELGATLSRRTINRHLGRVVDAVERRQDINREAEARIQPGPSSPFVK